MPLANTNVQPETTTEPAIAAPAARSAGRPWHVLAALGAVLVFAHVSPMGSATAANSASFLAEEPTVPFNATQQRKEMIARLDRIDRRLVQLESSIAKGINVTVTEMPPVTISNVNDIRD